MQGKYSGLVENCTEVQFPGSQYKSTVSDSGLRKPADYFCRSSVPGVVFDRRPRAHQMNPKRTGG